jgi:hypothetical protein
MLGEVGWNAVFGEMLSSELNDVLMCSGMDGDMVCPVVSDEVTWPGVNWPTMWLGLKCSIT